MDTFCKPTINPAKCITLYQNRLQLSRASSICKACLPHSSTQHSTARQGNFLKLSTHLDRVAFEDLLLRKGLGQLRVPTLAAAA
jgi:hypothetical protein